MMISVEPSQWGKLTITATPDNRNIHDSDHHHDHHHRGTRSADVSIMSLSDCYYSASVKTSSQSSSSQHLFDHLDVIILTIFIIITIHNIKYSRYYHQPGWRNHRCQLGTRSLKFPRWHHHYGATSLEIILSPKIPWSDTMTSLIQIHRTWNCFFLTFKSQGPRMKTMATTKLPDMTQKVFIDTIKIIIIITS